MGKKEKKKNSINFSIAVIDEKTNEVDLFAKNIVKKKFMLVVYMSACLNKRI